MMAKTHLTVGMATALALATITTPAECAIAVAGGALGGVLADVDTLKNDNYEHDALIGELLALGITAAVAALDFFLDWGICKTVLADKSTAIDGAIGFVVLWIIGFNQRHRQFTHSLLAMMLFSACLGIIYSSLGAMCVIGYFSHLALDIMNKKGIRLLFPLKAEWCFKWCYASKTANTVFMWIGLIATVALLIYRILSLSVIG